MRKVEFFDTSLRDGEQTPGVNFSIKEKVSIARQLEKWGISVIEAGFPAASPDSFIAVQEIAKAMKKTAVTGLARSVKSDIDACYEALKDAKYPQIHVFIATSPIHRKYKLNKSKEEILEAIKEHETRPGLHSANLSSPRKSLSKYQYLPSGPDGSKRIR